MFGRQKPYIAKSARGERIGYIIECQEHLPGRTVTNIFGTESEIIGKHSRIIIETKDGKSASTTLSELKSQFDEITIRPFIL